MFWRKKSDGFEWHKYVRTTIKLRREDRRRRIDGIKVAAAEGLAGAGRAGVNVGNSLLHRFGKAVVKPFTWIGAGAAVAGRGAGRICSRVADTLYMPLLPVARYLERSETAPLLAMAAVVAGLLATGRAWVVGWDLITSIEAAVAAVCAAVLLLPALVTGRGPARLVEVLRYARRPGGMLPTTSSTSRGFLRVVGAVAISAVVVVAGWLGLSTVTRLPSPTLAALPGLSNEVVKGAASAVSGDTLRIEGRIIRLAGIDAPEAGQNCREVYGKRGRSRSWRCGVAAQRALRELVRGKIVSCELSGADKIGRKIAGCNVAGKDLSAELVREGHVFAQPGVFSTYGRLEQDARNAKAGIWRGEAERPDAYRRRLWALAKRRAPDGCPIKGNIAAGKRLYVVPWSPSYRRTRVSQQRGERWFCSEEEAMAAGWQPGERS